MAVAQHVLDFSPAIVGALSEETTRQEVFDKLRSFGLKGPIVSCDLEEDQSSFMFVFAGDKKGDKQCARDAVLRSFPNGLITLDITCHTKEGKEQLKMQDLQGLHQSLNKVLGCKMKYRLRAPLRRGTKLDQYLYTSDDRTLEYDFDELVLDVQSPYQHIEIYHSKQYGNCLVLDDLINLAESDLLYTQTILGEDRHCYEGKTVLVLGGGDGGILHELLKKEPKFVTMLEIDQMVVDSSKKFLRGICGNSLDTLQGANYEVLVTDCVPVLKKYIEEGKQFDFVINDLTDVPIAETEKDLATWSLLIEIMELGLKVLAQDGKLLTHAIGVTCQEAIASFEKKLESLNTAVEYKSDTAFVPSFQELWVFYELWKKSSSNHES